MMWLLTLALIFAFAILGAIDFALRQFFRCVFETFVALFLFFALLTGNL